MPPSSDAERTPSAAPLPSPAIGTALPYAPPAPARRAAPAYPSRGGRRQSPGAYPPRWRTWSSAGTPQRPPDTTPVPSGESPPRPASCHARGRRGCAHQRTPAGQNPPADLSQLRQPTALSPRPSLSRARFPAGRTDFSKNDHPQRTAHSATAPSTHLAFIFS